MTAKIYRIHHRPRRMTPQEEAWFWGDMEESPAAPRKAIPIRVYIAIVLAFVGGLAFGFTIAEREVSPAAHHFPLMDCNAFSGGECK